MKIKTLMFRVSVQTDTDALSKIDNEVHEFCKDKRVIDIKTTSSILSHNYRNNSEIICLIYTILYENYEDDYDDDDDDD